MDITKLDLNLLVIFETMLRLQNVSRAAEAMGMSQPALSFALNKLRTLFGDPLFIRGSRGMQPTPRAQQLCGTLHSVLDLIRIDLLQKPVFDPKTAQRTFTFNMSDIGEMIFLPTVLKRLSAAAPGVSIKTVSTPHRLLEDALQSGDVDLIMGYYPGLAGAAIYQQRLCTRDFVCIMRKDHPGIGDRMSLKQFLQAGHVVVQPAGRSHEQFETELEQQGLTRKIVLSVAHYIALPTIIAESDLIATVPHAVGSNFAKLANIKVLRPPMNVPTVELMQYWHARFHHDPANIWIRNVIADLYLQNPRAQRTQEPRTPAARKRRSPALRRAAAAVR